MCRISIDATNVQGKGRRGGGGGGGGRGNSSTANGGGWRDYAPFDKNNEKLENYYNSLLQLPDEEKQQYWEYLRRELPNSFRFTGSRGCVLINILTPITNVCGSCRCWPSGVLMSIPRPSLAMPCRSSDSSRHATFPRYPRSSIMMDGLWRHRSPWLGTPTSLPGG